MRDMCNNTQVKRVLSPASVSDDTPQVGQIIDRLGYGSLTYVIATGSLADAEIKALHRETRWVADHAMKLIGAADTPRFPDPPAN